MVYNASDRQAWHGGQQRSAAAGFSGRTAAHQQEQQVPPVARQGRDHSQSRCSRQGVSAMLALTVLLLVGVSVADAAATHCRVTPPVCPSRSEALARRPVFEMETPQRVQVEAGPKPAHKQRKHRATPATATQQSPAGTSFVPRMSRDAAVSLLVAMGSRKERLFVQDSPALTSDAAQQGAPVQDMAQRVMPTVDLPAMSDAAQQALFSQLLDVLQGTSVSSSIVVGPAASGVPQQQVTGAAATGVAPVVPVNVPQVPSAGCGSASGCGTLFLDNARLRVGVDTGRGGAISFISSPVMPPEWANVNLVNTWDAGRLIQQSYYGCYDDTCWLDRPWRWNPVQGGSWQNGPPKLLASSMGAASVTVASVPRNWGGQQLLDDVLMVTETELHPNVVKVRFTMRYTGDVPHPDAHQEVPAVFVNRRLNVLAMYSGEQPWSNGDLTFIMPGQTGEYYRPTERWAAYVDQDSGFGLGVYTPVASQLVAYRIGPEKSTAQSDVSYMAPLVTANIQPNTEFSYDAYIAVGRVDEMRGWFAEIASRVAPTNEAGSYKRPIAPSTLQTPLQTPVAQQVPATQQVADGRSTDAARLPRSVEKLVAYQPSAVQVNPTSSDAVGFAKAVSTNQDADLDSKVARPSLAGVKLTPKPAKQGAGAAAARKPSTPADSKAQQPSKARAAAAAAAAAAAGTKPQHVPPRNARLGNVRREAGHAQASVGAVGATSLEQQTERWSRPTITHIKRPAGSTVAVAAATQQVAQQPATQQVAQPVQQQQQQQQPASQQVAQPVQPVQQQHQHQQHQQSMAQPAKQQQWSLQLGEQQQPAPQQGSLQPGKEQQQQQPPAPQEAVQPRPTTQQPVQQQQQPAPKPQQPVQQQPVQQQPQQPQQPKQAQQQPAPQQPTPQQQQQQQPKPAPVTMPLAARQAEPEPGRGLSRVDPSQAAHSIKAHPGNYPTSDRHTHDRHEQTQSTARDAEPRGQSYAQESPRNVAEGYPRGRHAVVEDLEQDWEWAHYQQQQQQQEQQQRRWEAEVAEAEEAEQLSDHGPHEEDSEHDRPSLQQVDDQRADEQRDEEQRDAEQRVFEAEQQQGTDAEQEEYEYVEIEVEDAEAETEGDAGNRDRDGETEVEVEVQEEAAADADADADAEHEHAYRLRQMELRRRYEQQQREEEEQRHRQEAEARLQRAAPQAEPEPPLQDQQQSKQKEDKEEEWDPKKAAQKSKHDGKSKHTSSQHKQHKSAAKDDKEHKHKHNDDSSHKKRHVTVKHTVKPSVKHSDKHTDKHAARTYTTVRRTTQHKKSPSAALARLNIDDELRERIESLLHDDGEADARIQQAIKARPVRDHHDHDHHDARKSDAPKRSVTRKWTLAKALAARRAAAAQAHSGAQHKAKTSASKSSKDAVSARIMSKQQAEQDVRVQMMKHEQKVLRKQELYANKMAAKANREYTGKAPKGLVAVGTAGASDAADKKVSIWRSLSNSLQKMIEATTQALQPAEPPKNQLPKCGERSNSTTTSICV